MQNQDLKTCPHCANDIVPSLYERHVDDCRGPLVFTEDACPMCGEEYDHYMTHLKDDCDARDA